MEANNVDSVLIPREQAMVANEAIPAQPVIQEPEAPKEQEIKENIAENMQKEEGNSQDSENTESLELKTDNKEVTNEDSPIDEYGNPVEKAKMYSEDEVQRMIRDRLSRGKHAEQPSPQQIQNDVQNFKPDPDSEESWEVQLENVINKTIDKRQTQEAERKWREQETVKQAQFEEKFTTGMEKYSDFRSVIAGKPITDGILLAARDLDNPAAFVYGASKLHPQELDRIARINDPRTQAVEVGRLHERMIKERKLSSKAPRPLEVPKSDMPGKVLDKQPPIEERIHAYGKQKKR